MTFRRLSTLIRQPASRFIYKIYPEYKINRFDDFNFLGSVYRKKSGLDACADEIETIALRGSSTDYGFSADVAHRSYNLGLSSCDFYTTHQIYKSVSVGLPNLKNVVVFFPPSAPGFDLLKTRERYRFVAYSYFFNISCKCMSGLNSKYEKSIIKKCQEISAPKLPDNYRGYEEKKYLDAQTDVINRAKTHLRENKREPDQMNWFRKTLYLANELQHKVTIVIPPVRSDFKHHLGDSVALFSKLYSIDLGKGKIINYYNDPIFSDRDMGDTDHLNRAGAIKMTESIMSAISSGS